jgi:hypothetical protein
MLVLVQLHFAVLPTTGGLKLLPYLLGPQGLLGLIKSHQPEARHLVVLIIGDVQVVRPGAFDAAAAPSTP